MISATITQADLNAAVEEWLRKKGIATTKHFAVRVKETPGDRPFESSAVEVTCTGVLVGGAA
jgi:tRNA(Ser,Leu) C12 N-acetylase TAN1